MEALDFFLSPFAFGFMRRALAGCMALAIAGPPLGIFLVMRRMSLMADVMQHGILPGIALGAIIGGASLPIMGLGGFIAGVAVAVLAGVLARATQGREDSQLAAVYVLALALGIALISGRQGIDLTHLLFGSALGIGTPALLLMAGCSSVVLLGLAVVWRPLIAESFDPGFLRAVGGGGAVWQLALLALTALCAVAGAMVLGTLMGIGLMMLPAVAARHFALQLAGQVRAAVVIAVLASFFGLVLSFHADLPAGPSVVLVAGLAWVLGLLVGPHASFWALRRRNPAIHTR